MKNIKVVVGVVLILLAAGAWFYLDMRNKQEIQAAEDARKEMDMLRARAKAAADAKSKFEAQILADLNSCKEQAAKAKEDFLAQPRKKSQQKAAQAEADKTLDAANATCQSTYDSRLAAGN